MKKVLEIILSCIGYFLVLTLLFILWMVDDGGVKEKKAWEAAYGGKPAVTFSEKQISIALFNDKGEYITQIIDKNNGNKVYRIEIIEHYATIKNGKKEVDYYDVPEYLKSVGVQMSCYNANDSIYIIYGDYKTTMPKTVKQLYEVDEKVKAVVAADLEHYKEAREFYFKKYGKKNAIKSRIADAIVTKLKL